MKFIGKLTELLIIIPIDITISQKQKQNKQQQQLPNPLTLPKVVGLNLAETRDSPSIYAKNGHPLLHKPLEPWVFTHINIV